MLNVTPLYMQASASSDNKQSQYDDQLVDAETLLKVLFPEECRPSLRWLRYRQQKRKIPFVRIGRLIFFNPHKVRESFEKQYQV